MSQAVKAIIRQPLALRYSHGALHRNGWRSVVVFSESCLFAVLETTKLEAKTLAVWQFVGFPGSPGVSMVDEVPFAVH